MKKYDLLTSVVLLILGILLLFIPGEIVTSVIRIFGIVILLLGVLSILGSRKKNTSDMVYGILIAILGIVFISNPEVIASIIPFILGVWIIIKSLFKLQYVSTLKNSSIDTVKPLIINIITLLLGITLVFNPFKGAETLIRIIGIFLIVYSGLDILDYFFTRPKKIKVIK